MKALLKFLILLAGLNFISFSCDDNRRNIPDISFRPIKIDLNDPEFSDLQDYPGFVYVTGGAYDKGLIIYRKNFEEFYAFDRSCPYDPEKGQVSVNEENKIFAIDSVCGSKFNLLYGGTVEEGPASRGLKKYNTDFNKNTMVLQVYN